MPFLWPQPWSSIRRSVTAQEAHSFRLVNLLATPPETALTAALRLANMLASHPQRCMRSDRRSAYEADSERGAMQREFELGMEVLKSQEFRDRVIDFLAKDGRSKRKGLIAAKNKSNLWNFHSKYVGWSSRLPMACHQSHALLLRH